MIAEIAAENGPLLEKRRRNDVMSDMRITLASAREILDSRGHPTTDGEIALARVGIGTLYRHFPTRAALVRNEALA